MKTENPEDKHIQHNSQHSDEQDIHRQHGGVPKIWFVTITLTPIHVVLLSIYSSVEVSEDAVEVRGRQTKCLNKHYFKVASTFALS